MALVCFALAATLAHGLSVKHLEPEPTADETGLFGPPFDIPLLDLHSGKPAVHVQMQLALTPPEDHHGLMFRKSLADNTGMLFMYQTPGQRVLWMKNTYIPLDAAWMTSDGMIQEVHDLIPHDLTYRWSDRDDIVMGLEMPGGYFKKHGFQPGTLRLDEQALSRALQARGVDPAVYPFLRNKISADVVNNVPATAQTAQPAQPVDQQSPLRALAEENNVALKDILKSSAEVAFGSLGWTGAAVK